MSDQGTSALDQSSALQAFEDLRGEVSLLRRAIEGLAAERRDQPDYGPTLEALAATNDGIREWAKKVSERPALELTPQTVAEQIEAAASRFRYLDRQDLQATQARLEGVSRELTLLARQPRTLDEQTRRVQLTGGACFLSGLILWPLLALVELIWR